jgi:hypothetical protein
MIIYRDAIIDHLNHIANSIDIINSFNEGHLWIDDVFPVGDQATRRAAYGAVVIKSERRSIADRLAAVQILMA